MASRVFFSLFIAFIAFAICSYAAEESMDDPNETDGLVGKVGVKIVAKLIGSLFVGSAANCVIEAATECKDHWKKPAAAINCAKSFIQRNKGRCFVSA